MRPRSLVLSFPLALLLTSCLGEPVAHEEGSACNENDVCWPGLTCSPEDRICRRACGEGEGEGEGAEGESICSSAWVRVAFVVQLATGMVDGACRPLDPWRWAEDDEGDGLFLVGGVHGSYTGASAEVLAEVDARLGGWTPNTVPMYDDGTHGDAVAGDDLWTLVLDLPQGSSPLRLAYKYTWGQPGQAWTSTEEWPGNSRLLEAVDRDRDGLVRRVDRFGDESSNKERVNAHPAAQGGLDWTTDLDGDEVPEVQEAPTDLDGDCQADGYPQVVAEPLAPCPGEREGEGEAAGQRCTASDATPPCNGCPAGTFVPSGWVCIPVGTFPMGSPANEEGRDDDETPHEATITRPYLMQATEVTQGQWASLMGTTPSYFTVCGGDCPVERVSWYEAVAYCNVLSMAEELTVCYKDSDDGRAYEQADASASKVPIWSGPGCRGYRLPTEAEWECAARARTTTATYGGDLDAAHLGCEQPNAVLDDLAWFCGNAGATTHSVATKDPNGWGLYDILGNVWEWCWDWYAAYPVATPDDYFCSGGGATQVFRGGSWSGNAGDARAADRSGVGPGSRSVSLGFRPVRSIP